LLFFTIDWKSILPFFLDCSAELALKYYFNPYGGMLLFIWLERC